MKTEQLLKRIVANPKTFAGAPCIRDTRVRVQTVLQLLAQGVSMDDVTRDLEISAEDVQACIAYAAASMAGDSLEAVEIQRA